MLFEICTNFNWLFITFQKKSGLDFNSNTVINSTCENHELCPSVHCSFSQTLFKWFWTIDVGNISWCLCPYLHTILSILLWTNLVCNLSCTVWLIFQMIAPSEQMPEKKDFTSFNPLHSTSIFSNGESWTTWQGVHRHSSFSVNCICLYIE